VIDRTFKPRRLLEDVITGTVVGTIVHFLLRYIEGWQGSAAELNQVLFLGVVFTIVFVALFKRYFPMVGDFKEKSGDADEEA
jgi:F0F1-type ATP synthase assembly protein I